MVRLGRIERPTTGLEGRCSILLSYRRNRGGQTCPAVSSYFRQRDPAFSEIAWWETVDLYFINIGATGFEPVTSWSQTKRSSQTEPRPG